MFKFLFGSNKTDISEVKISNEVPLTLKERLAEVKTKAQDRAHKEMLGVLVEQLLFDFVYGEGKHKEAHDYYRNAHSSGDLHKYVKTHPFDPKILYVFIPTNRYLDTQIEVRDLKTAHIKDKLVEQLIEEMKDD